MNNSAVISDFINYLKFEKHFSEHTAKCYRADLIQFTTFLAGHKPDGHSNTAAVVNPWEDTSATATATATQT